MKRTYMTHVVLLCDEPRLQPVLPQVLVGSPTVFRQRDMIALRSIVPSNVFLARQKKSLELDCAFKGDSGQASTGVRSMEGNTRDSLNDGCSQNTLSERRLGCMH